METLCHCTKATPGARKYEISWTLPDVQACAQTCSGPSFVLFDGVRHVWRGKLVWTTLVPQLSEFTVACFSVLYCNVRFVLNLLSVVLAKDWKGQNLFEYSCCRRISNLECCSDSGLQVCIRSVSLPSHSSTTFALLLF